MDTVGAVCMDSHGHLCAGVSSGGVVYKTPGRIGQVRVPHYCTVTIPPHPRGKLPYKKEWCANWTF